MTKGFIGANFVLDWVAQADDPVINSDKLTTFETRIRKTAQWYPGNHEWVSNIHSVSYLERVENNYFERLA